ncbi:hypothetical protein Fcan01_11910 [Folsomia candida]|uniref:Uncharacterized protein n=1 Tax=Folsomia candida TaxID=158441 RepID=A0A226E5G9_FOLCA|nr:hypothetical protein Fcan01_11910 [Folsomia candida]
MDDIWLSWSERKGLSSDVGVCSAIESLNDGSPTKKKCRIILCRKKELRDLVWPRREQCRTRSPFENQTLKGTLHIPFAQSTIRTQSSSSSNNELTQNKTGSFSEDENCYSPA